MSVLNLPRHPGLFSTTRLGLVISNEMTATYRDWMILIAAGIGAACASVFLDLRIQRVPGHAILRVVFPMAVGLALVPRKGAGCVMGATGFVTGLSLYLAGFKGEGIGVGALASLTATGPILDWTLRRSKGGWWQYVLFGLAGLASNTLAFVVRASAKAMGWEMAGRRPLGEWIMQASVTYLLCGLAAGLISGIILFYGRKTTESQTETHL